MDTYIINLYMCRLNLDSKPSELAGVKRCCRMMIHSIAE